jgi:hypothetical protein
VRAGKTSPAANTSVLRALVEAIARFMRRVFRR